MNKIYFNYYADEVKGLDVKKELEKYFSTISKSRPVKNASEQIRQHVVAEEDNDLLLQEIIANLNKTFGRVYQCNCTNKIEVMIHRY